MRAWNFGISRALISDSKVLVNNDDVEQSAAGVGVTAASEP